MRLRLIRIAAVLGVALAVCLATGPSGSQPPKEGKAAEGTEAYRLVPPLTLQDDGPVNSVAYSPNARLLASSTVRSSVRLWDACTGKPLWRHRFEIRNAPMYEVTFSPDGRTLACAAAYGTVRLLDVRSGQELAVLLHAERGAVDCVAFSPDGRWLVSGGKGLVVWDLRTQKRHMQLLGPEEEVGSVAYSPDGKNLASASSADRSPTADWPLRIWDGDTGKERAQFRDQNDGKILSLRFAPGGKTLACGNRYLLPRGKGIIYGTRVREVATGRTTVKIPDPGYGVAFSPDGDLLLVSGGGQSGCRLWETATAKEVHTLVRRWSDVRRVAFSPDGRAVALGSTDHTVLIQRFLTDLATEGNAPLGADALEQLWTNLGAEDAEKRYQAIWTLAAKPAEAVPFLKGRFKRAEPGTGRKIGQHVIRILELIDTPETRQLLQQLANESGDGAVKQDVLEALNRLEARTRIMPLSITPDKPHDAQR